MPKKLSIAIIVACAAVSLAAAFDVPGRYLRPAPQDAVTPPSPPPAATADFALQPSSADLAGWQTFGDPALGFGISYPRAWHETRSVPGPMADGRDGLGLLEVVWNDERARLTVEVRPVDTTLDGFEREYVTAAPSFVGSTSARTTIGGLPATSVVVYPLDCSARDVPPCEYMQRLLVMGEDRLFDMTFRFTGTPKDEAEATLVDWRKSLGTFRVLPAGPEGGASDGWTQYRDEALGFEMKHPKAWGVGSAHVGIGGGGEGRFWNEVVGNAFWGSDGVNLRVTVKRADLTLEEFDGFGGGFLGLNPRSVTVGGLPALRTSGAVGCDSPLSGCSFREEALIKQGDRFFAFSLTGGSTSNDVAKSIPDDWEKVLATFKALPLSE